MSNVKGSVAIIGAGLGGISAARFMKSQGFEPTVLESHSGIGGQWDRENENSGIWPEMRTNTARFTTKLSDVQYPEHVSLFPRNAEVLDMMNDYINVNDLGSHIKTDCKVTIVEVNSAGGHTVMWAHKGKEISEHFDKVIVASGRYNKPEIPEIEGLDSFSGDMGAKHTFYYEGRNAYRDKVVVVCGSSISALEIASDLAMAGTKRVHIAQRTQRWIINKMIRDVPHEYLAFTREAGLGIRETPKPELLAGFIEFLKMYGGDPSTYGAPPPPYDMTEAKITASQSFLPLVAEDRIDTKPWIKKVEGRKVTFTDGSTVECDAILIGTGFELSLDYLSDDIAKMTSLNKRGLDLAEHTFHPDLPDLAFIGLYNQLGPYSTPLELQARWIAYVWGGEIESPTEQWLRDALKRCQDEDVHGDYVFQNEMGCRFGQYAGVDPGSINDPELAKILPYCAVVGEMFRLAGPDADPKAREYLLRDFYEFAPKEVKDQISAADSEA